MRSYIVGIIRGYQYLSRALAAQGLFFARWSGCRQWPTCSEFTLQAVRREGVVRGALKGMGRVARCNPFYRPVA